MLRLALHMSLRSGREALIRLLITMAAVGIGVALLLSVLAIYHGYETTANRACWQCTGQEQADQPGPGRRQEPASQPSADTTTAELWNYNEDFYQGRTIERLDIAALGPQAPIVPGLSRLPGAGEYYVSPALATLIASTPHDELGARFPGTGVGTIGAKGLSGPDDLAIIIGYSPADLAKAAGTSQITTIETGPHLLGTSSIYQFGFGLGAVALLLPMFILIGNASRFAAARREERYAAMRLVGATIRQVSIIASMDALIGALLGSVLGIGLYALVRPLATRVTITGSRFFPDYVTPTAAGYIAVLIGVPAAAAVAALLSLRRVGISPLGVSRRATPPAPRAWRVVPLLIGIVVFIVPLALDGSKNPNAGLAILGLILVMIGLLVGGTWLTMQASRVLARFGRGASSLLAARRMADNPQAAFRSVSGLVLAVFVGTLVAGAVPAALAAQRTPADTALNNVLRVPLAGPTGGLLPEAGAALVQRLTAFPGVSVLPLYDAAANQTGLGFVPLSSIVSCAELTNFSALGTCAPGVAAVEMDPGSLLYTDNVASLNKSLPLVNQHSSGASADLTGLKLDAVLVKADNAATLERVRTFLAVMYQGVSGFATDAPPQTIGEVAKVRGALYTELGQVVLLIVGLTLLVAGCSLAIAMGGGMIERKRPFTLLRVSGTAARVLRRVVLLESVLPLVAATVVAAVTGFAVAVPINIALSPPGTTSAIQYPDHTYYLVVGTGLIICLAIIMMTLPLLNRSTVPDSARFE